MAHRITRRLESLLDHYAALCLALAVVILSLLGVGNVSVTAPLGLVLCAAGMMQDSLRVDLWVLIPLTLYTLADMAASYAAYGTLMSGYGGMHALFPVLYLLRGSLDGEDHQLVRRCCALWAGAAAVIGLGGFALEAVTQSRVARLSGLLGNPNAMGIFLVVGWFTVMYCAVHDKDRSWAALLTRLEPVLLIALALTLSMGSFLAMAAGITLLALEQKRRSSWGETLGYVCRLLAKAVLGVGTGVLVYLAAARTDVPWVCLLVLAYGAAVTAYWPSFGRFLEVYPKTAALLSALGVLIAGAAVLLRPSAVATFAQRVEMIASGLPYLAQNPLFGVGPFQWRMLDLNDGGTYFNTWHIHNIPLHIGVEIGWLAMAAVIVAGLRAVSKRKPPLLRAGTTAFLVHNLMDTSFFYLGITGLTLVAAGEPETGGQTLQGGAVKAVFGLFALIFAYSLYTALV